MKTLRDYQVRTSKQGLAKLNQFRVVYIAAEVRTGKSAIAMDIAKNYGSKKVLFLTKKKAISSIEEDYKDFGFDQYFDLTVVNDESMHKVGSDFDLVIHDEHHRFGAFPKPGKATKLYKQLFKHLPQIWLSGTPSPESWSQLYHQFWVCTVGPWEGYRNFYAWAADNVTIKEKYLGPTHRIKDYKGVDRDKDNIFPDIEKYMIYLTQEEAGFKGSIEEEILHVKMKPRTYSMCKTLLDDLLVEGKEEVILADTPAKLRSKLHQLYSGTVKFESGGSMVLDRTKAEFIAENFKDNKMAIFYVFTEEFNALKDVLGDRITDDLSTFNEDPDKWIALQIVSGREGMNLSKADYLVYYNIHDSALSYWQGRDRMTTMDRTFNKVFWVFSSGGIEDKIYRTVTTKKANYTNEHFKRDYSFAKQPKRKTTN
jgi:hypothetical protein